MTMITYKNRNGKPMIRSCGKCRHFRKMDAESSLGYCLLSATLFAYTMERTVYDIKKSFYLCEKHEFSNEEWLAENAESVDLKSILKSKDAVD